MAAPVLLAQPDGPLAFVGLTHLSAGYGAVLRCIRRNGRWSTKLVARIEGTPTAAASAADGGAVFVTAHGVGRVSPSGVVRTLLRRVFDGLYPSSIATDAEPRTTRSGPTSATGRPTRTVTWSASRGCARCASSGGMTLSC